MSIDLFKSLNSIQHRFGVRKSTNAILAQTHSHKRINSTTISDSIQWEEISKVFYKILRLLPSADHKSLKMRYILCFAVIFAFATGLSGFRLAIRLCFRDPVADTKNDCAYCNLRTLSSTAGQQDNVWTAQQKHCILTACRKQHPSQKILPTLVPLQSMRAESG
ncbi:uncharacterized protein CDAR_430931 [Caerostris darwini]|uniref:Uncharacterized protein n=1 Tax=Caerostris darwini TaxID=1538125 RepID=A0AAV4WG60_9ARAC|nr:uncharacterized protein CDAR_430931 [Caerostris darwini]